MRTADLLAGPPKKPRARWLACALVAAVGFVGASSGALGAEAFPFPLPRPPGDAGTALPGSGPDIRQGALYRLVAEGSCPTTALVDAALAPLLSTEGPDGLKPPAVVQLADLGDRFSVAVAGRERTYLDPTRRCEERARVAAIFSALTLRPPTLLIEETPPPAPQLPPVIVARTRRTELAGSFATASGLSSSAWGGRVAFLVVTSSWTLGAEAAVLGLARANFVMARADLVRVPVGVTAFRTIDVGVVEWRAGLGLGVDVVRVHGLDLAPGSTSYRVNPALHAELGALLWPQQRISPQVVLQGSFAPRALHLTVATPSSGGTETEIGVLPHFWLGFSLGLSAKW